MSDRDKSPLLDHALDQPAAFTPEALVDAVRAERGLAPEPVPAVCVLEFDGDLTDWLEDRNLVRPAPHWACFHTRMSLLDVDGSPCGIVPRTIGGPYAVLVSEQLFASGAKVVIGLTSSGRVLPSLPIPSLVVATSAVRDEGTSYHYLPPTETVAAPVGVPETLAEEVAAVGLPVARGQVWTTDAPYRETREQLDRHAAAGVLAVEMQAASLFALAAARNVATAVVAHVTNAIDHDGEDFDKGREADGLRLLQCVCRGGLRFLRRG